MSMTNEKWLSDVAKTGEYKDLINKPTVVTDIESDASENTLASSKSVKIVYDKVEEALNKANDSKIKIATSLNTMGVATDENDTFESLSEKIKTITDDATATADTILEGEIAYAKGKKITGSMKNNNNINANINSGEVYKIPTGFHYGGGTVTANSLASQTPGNATSAHILSGFNAWSNGQNFKGTLTLDTLNAVKCKTGEITVEQSSGGDLSFDVNYLGYSPMICIITADSYAGDRSIIYVFIKKGGKYNLFDMVNVSKKEEYSNYNGYGYGFNSKNSNRSSDTLICRCLFNYNSMTFVVPTYGTNKDTWTVRYMIIG